MRTEPADKRVFTFFDGQNVFHSVKEAFGYSYPNYDPLALSKLVCDLNGWKLEKVNFYTGIPEKSRNPYWHHFWEHKLGGMGKRGIATFSRAIRYFEEHVELPDGSEKTFLVVKEKGIDVRIALDMVRLARQNLYDVAVIFSQDQDLSEVATEVREISNSQDRWIKVACAFPQSPSFNQRGINGTDWIRIDRLDYDKCLDPTDYR